MANDEKQHPIRELIAQMKEMQDVNDDNFPDLIKGLESATAGETDLATAAILHSMTAEMYNRYYQLNRWKIDQRTPIAGYVPDDMREWTSNIFTAKVKEELEASLQNAGIVQQTPVSRFKDILEAGEDSEELRPTVYDFLLWRAIDIQPSDGFYEELLAFRRAQPGGKAALMAELAFLRYTRDRDYSPKSRDAYEASLDSLLQTSEGKDYSVEIISDKLQLLQNKGYDAASADSLRTLQYELAKRTIERFPGYSGTAKVENLLASLEEPRVQLQGQNTVYPGTRLELKLNYTNVSRVNVKIYKSLKPIVETQAYYVSDEKEPRRGEMVKELHWDLPIKNSYTPADTTLRVPMDAPGLYEYELSVPGTEKLTVRNLFSVSRLAAVSRSLSSGRAEVIVTDYRSGKPVKDAVVSYYGGGRKNLELKGSVRTDTNGLAALPTDGEISFYHAGAAGDTSLFITNIYVGRDRYEEQETRTRVSLLTDRGIYRPGQTVYFKGIAYDNRRDNPSVTAGKRYEVILRDANYKEVTTLKLTTNQYGSFSGEFQLPRAALNGNFTISTENGSTHFRVEEYKRPTFMIEIPPVKEDVSYGDEVTIRGTARTFSGVALQSGDVAYRVVRRPFWLRIFWNDYSEEQVAEGRTTVSADGTFSFSFRPEKKDRFFPFCYNTFDVIATLTSSTGESQEERSSFQVGDRSIFFQTNLTAEVEKESARPAIQAKTLNGEDVKLKGTYTIVALEDTGEEGKYKEGRALGSGSFASGEPLPQSALANLASGRLRLKMKANDTKGREVEQDQDFILYSLKDKRPPVSMHTWLVCKKQDFLPGETAEILFGTSDKEAYVLYELFAEGKAVSRQRLVMTDENKTFSIPFLESYADGVFASFTFIKEGELYNRQFPITKRRPDRTLSIRKETFRDRLLPGNQESWTLRITDKDSAIVAAEVLAGMYDASLDKIIPFKWFFHPEFAPVMYQTNYSRGQGMSSRSGYASAPPVYRDVRQYSFNRLDWQGLMDAPQRVYALNGMRSNVVMKSAAPNQSAAFAEDASIIMQESADMAGEVAAPTAARMQEEAAPSAQIRTNFSETAFFFPSLTTDREGNININFTIPESNTTWKFQALAHTKDLKSAIETAEVITQKPLMVQPNLPRFLRSGDKVTISAQVMNQTGGDISTTARLELLDPNTEKPLEQQGAASQTPERAERQTLKLKTNETATVSWDIAVPAGLDLVICRITAESPSASDGEQHLIPVLPREIMLTESTPFYLTGKGEKTVDVPKGAASSTRRPYRMTLEYSGNPAWYAVQALPTVADPSNDNIISWFAAYYVNTLASSIARSNTKIKSVIDRWNAEGGTSQTLYSNLEKNEELKGLLLEETPWVMDAKSETEQKQRLALLFDTNRSSQQREAAMKILHEQQMEEGGWGWFKGFFPSRAITLYILNGMAQLVQLNAIEFTQQEREMQIKALQFLDKSIQKDYERLTASKAKGKDYVPTLGQLEYLYVRSYYRDIPEYGEAREGIRFFTAQAEKQWKKLSLKGKAETALVMHRNGNKAAAKEIIAWLRKTATTAPEMGMHWANNRRENNFFVSPVDIHCLLMKAFDETDPKADEADRMKQWLLNQKRTQNWETVSSTVNAVYTLLSTGSDWLGTDNNSTLRWGSRTITPSAAATGTGYVKEVATAGEIQPDMHRVTIQKEAEPPAWGAVYYQYFEEMDKVTKQKGVMNVEKKLFVETNSGTQRQITPVADGRPLKVGDKVIVRLTIRTDREMEYVSLKDLRAGCFEPVSQTSGTVYAGGLRYYRSPKDISENFYFDTLPAGTHVLEYSAYVSRAGRYSGGLATLQCLYAPEFVSHTEGGEIIVAINH